MRTTAPFGDAAQRAVLRAAQDLARGWPVGLAAGSNTALVLAAEYAGDAERRAMTAGAGGASPWLVTTARRAFSLGLPPSAGATGIYHLDEAAWHRLGELAAAPIDLQGVLASEATLPTTLVDAALSLCRIGELLPMAALWPSSPHEAETLGAVTVDAATVRAHRERLEGHFEPAIAVPLPLADAPDTRVLTFRQPDRATMHLAFLVGDVEAAAAPLCRLHSACFTGDVLGSLRCDCGEQLRGALARMQAEGAGILLYLAQEGRGIGLVNKLRAYRLQDAGSDTIDANHRLGFDDDERDYRVAARMLDLLGVRRVRFLSNNPAKLQALTSLGIEVVERLPIAFDANRHNRRYLKTKAARSGHDLATIAPSLEDPPHG
ncbi:MAG: GTP cyclohydrolase II [Geminicoccaceae bacterium]|nr:MAG: GTP cyclohydrolase II [Geminicoccaceae bacterium]